MNNLDYNKHDNAPEVLPSEPQKDHEGLQLVEARPHYYPQQPPLELVNDATASSNHQHFAEQHQFNSLQQGEKPSGNTRLNEPVFSGRKRKRRKWIIAGIVILILAALAIGLGVGLTVALANDGGGSSNPSLNTPNSTSAPSTSTASATSSAVTSGGTGLAAFSCTSNADVTTSSGTSFTQECFTQYRSGGPDFYNSSATVENLGGRLTVYTFPSCMGECDMYNSNLSSNDAACRAVTYYANLTAPVQMWGGNCFLKSGRGVGYNGDPVDYSHTASAWMKCLGDGSC